MPTNVDLISASLYSNATSIIALALLYYLLASLSYQIGSLWKTKTK